jgi:hypothetical protein
MSEFKAYLQLGFEHITDPNGYDHILFIVALCAVYSLHDWKKVLVLVTAFTLGHSVTLALATLNLVEVDTDWVELLIPITILITAILNLFYRIPKRTLVSEMGLLHWRRYGMAAAFGLIHGLGFSNYLRSLLGKESELIGPLFAFNIGLEVGQLVIVIILLLIAFIVTDVLKASKAAWNYVISGIVIGMAITLIINNELFQTLRA